MKRLAKRLTFALVSLMALTLYAGGPAVVPDQLIVRFEDFVTADDAQLILPNQGVVLERQISRPLNLWVLKCDLSQTTLQAVESAVEKTYGVLYVQKDHMLDLRLEPDDPMFSSQWGFNNTGQTGGVEDADIDAPEAWEITTGGTNALGYEIVVAVVDEGFDITHEDLIDNFWRNPGDTLGNGIDDDGNGWVDDSLGWNAYGHNGNIPTSSHGTHVSGTVGARSNNGNQVSGVNWQVKIMTVAGASTSTSIAMEGYSYILDQKLLWLETGGAEGAFVVATNSSFGIDNADCESGSYPTWNDMYNAMGAAGILSAAATTNANNNVDVVGDVPTTCSSPYMIGVTNTNSSDEKAYAGYGPENIDLGAPGSSILSTNWYGGTSTKTGTSMASPHVAGAIGLMHAAANEALADLSMSAPQLSADIMRTLLMESVDPLEDLAGITVTGGRLNLYHAVLAAQGWEGVGDGNMNGDDHVNIQDVIVLTQLILGNIEPTNRMMIAGDLDADDAITVQDLVRLIAIILG